jgi:hypothetical protein
VTRAARALPLLGLYACLVAWLTWPLASHITTHLPAPRPSVIFDLLFSAWAASWESHALTSDPARFFDANIFHPTERALLYGPMGLGLLIYFLPVFVVSDNPALALNLALLASLSLTAWGLHLLVLRWTGSHLGGIVAAWTFLTTRWLSWEFAVTAPGYAVLQYFPLIVLLAASPPRGLAGVTCLATLILVQGLSDLYVAAACLLPLGTLVLVRLLRRRSRAAGLRLLAALVPSAGGLFVVYSGYWLVYRESPETLWTHPTLPTALPWGLLGYLSPTAVPFATLVLIAIALPLHLLADARRSESRHAWAQGAFWAVVGTIISLGPVVFWRGTIVTLPHAPLLAWLPIYEALRVPSRLGVAGLIGLCVLAGAAFAECERRLRSRAFRGPGVLLALLAVATYLDYSRGYGRPPFTREPLGPFRLARAPALHPPIQRLLRETGGPLLELPVRGRGLSPPAHAEAMYHSISHWQPLLNGYSSFYPAGFAERMATAERLPEPHALRALRRETGLRLILVHLEAMRGPNRRAWIRQARQPEPTDLELVAKHRGDLLFEVSSRRRRSAATRPPDRGRTGAAAGSGRRHPAPPTAGGRRRSSRPTRPRTSPRTATRAPRGRGERTAGSPPRRAPASGAQS